MKRIVTVTAVLAAAVLVASVQGAGARTHTVRHAAGTATAELLRWGGYVSGTPVQLALPVGVEPVAVSAGMFHELALGSDGVVYAWGQNGGALGDGTTTSTLSPEAIALPGGVHARAISAGGRHSLALGTDGIVYAWGHNDEGQLGDGTTTTALSPEPVALPGGVHAVAVAAGWRHSLALGTDGVVYAWGSDYSGELGDGKSGSDLYSTTPQPVVLSGGMKATAIAAANAAGNVDSFAIGEDGNIYAWGNNSSGQLGDGTQTLRDTPVLVSLPDGAHAAAVSAGLDHTIALDTDGTVYTWGFDDEGQLGDNKIARFTPQPIVLPDALSADAVSAGNGTSLAAASLHVPRFLIASPPANATVGSTIDYTFTATGAPTFSLSAGAPAWLSIDATSGELTGTLPADATTFSFSVTATNSTGSATAGPFTVTVPQAPVHVSGTVTGGGAPVTGALVDACLEDGSVCAGGTTDVAGAFTVSVPANNSLQLRVYPPTGSGLLQSGTALQVATTDVQDVAIELPTPTSLGPIGLSGTVGTSDGMPVIHWARTTGITISGCAGGFGLASVIARNTATGKFESDLTPLSETSQGSGSYSGTLPPQAPLHGPARIGGTADCDHPSPRRLASAAFSETGIVALLNVIGPQILTSKRNYQTFVKTALDAAHPSCSSDKAAAKAVAALALAPFIKGFVNGLLPEIETEVVLALAETGPVDLLVAVAVPPFMTWMAGKFADYIAGVAVDTFMADCPPPNGLDPNALIDPSGTVVDTNGNPLAGATVTILRGDAQAGPFAAVDPTQPGIEPAVDPETTGADGAFHWDVRSGWYEVQAAASGCTAPGQAAQPTATIGPYPVPPPQLGLTITLECPNEAPAPQPAVQSLSESSGPVSGGTEVQILGSGFTPASTVSFGSTAATSVTYLSPEALTAVSPAGAGRVDVVVGNGSTESSTSASDTFFYGASPTVTGVSENSGPVEGGTTVTVTGTGFTGATGVAFGGTLSAAVHVVSDSTLTVTTPAESTGTVDVVVVNPVGESAAAPADRFTFVASGDSSGSGSSGGTPPTPPSPAPGGGRTTDTQPPRPVPSLHGRVRRGTLLLHWLPATDDVGVDHYVVYLNGVAIERLAATTTSVGVGVHVRHGLSLYTVLAVDAAGNRSAAGAAVAVRSQSRPKAAPKHIPRWGWRLLVWRVHGRHGARPRVPKRLPHWYAAWTHWRLQPFAIVA